MTRSVPAKLSGQSAHPTRVSRTRAGLYVFSNNKKGPNRPNRTGPPDGLAVCLPGCNRLKLPGCSSDFAYHKYSGIGTYFKAKIAQENRGFRQCRKLIFFQETAFQWPRCVLTTKSSAQAIRSNKTGGHGEIEGTFRWSELDQVFPRC